MQITDNLKNDISDAPAWFHDAINIKPSEKILEDANKNEHKTSFYYNLIDTKPAHNHLKFINNK